MSKVPPTPFWVMPPAPLRLPLKVMVLAVFVTLSTLLLFKVPVPLRVRLLVPPIEGVLLAAKTKLLPKLAVSEDLKVPPFKLSVPVPRAFVATPICRMPLVSVVIPVYELLLAPEMLNVPPEPF